MPFPITFRWSFPLAAVAALCTLPAHAVTVPFASTSVASSWEVATSVNATLNKPSLQRSERCVNSSRHQKQALA